MNQVPNGTIAKLRELVDSALCASSKASAKTYLDKLKFEASYLTPTLDPYVREKLANVISYCGEASGRSPNRDHWENVLAQAWYLFETRVKEEKLT